MNIQEVLNAKIADQQAIIDAHDISREEAKKIQDNHPSVDIENDLKSWAIWEAYYDANSDALRVANAYDLIDRLKANFDQNIFHAKTRYVIGQQGDQLLSPAGFNTSDRVFVSTGSFVVQVNDLKDAPKASNKTLVAWDIDKMCDKAID